jgi:hypothetical protein
MIMDENTCTILLCKYVLFYESSEKREIGRARGAGEANALILPLRWCSNSGLKAGFDIGTTVAGLTGGSGYVIPTGIGATSYVAVGDVFGNGGMDGTNDVPTNMGG